MGYLAKMAMLTGLLLGCATTVWAEFRLTPGVELRQEYDDNIYLEPDDEEDDFITTITPSLLMTWESPRIDLSLDARINFQKYYDHTDEDRIGPGEADQGSTFNALVKVYPEVLFLRVTDSYQRVPIDEGDRGGEGNNVVNLTDSNTFTINPYLQFEPMSDLQVKLGYTYENLWYGQESGDNLEEDDDDRGDDSESHIYNLTLTKALSSKVTLTLDGEHLEYRPKNPDDTYVVGEDGVYEYDRDSVRGGLSCQLSERLTLKGGYGHAWVDYEFGYDEDSAIWDVSADYEFSDTTKAGIAFSSDYTVTVEDGPSEKTRYSAYVAYDKRIKLRASAFTSTDEYVEQDREDDAVGGALEGIIPFSDKNGLDWRLRYTNYDQSGVDPEEYDRYGAGISFYHDISLGRLSLGYTYEENKSDQDENDYTNNIIFVAAKLTF